jgi:hypothetical protein
MSAALSALSGASDSAAVSESISPIAAPISEPTSSISTHVVGGTKKIKTSSASQNPLHTGKSASNHDFATAKKRTSSKTQKIVPLRQTAFTQAVPPSMTPPEPLKPSVVFPEAIALREKKRSLQSRLNILLDERQKYLHQENSLSKMKSAIKVNAKGACVLPYKFPQRRKTQWDYVMEEMRWLATDFCEERKWKACSARIFSSAVVTHLRSHQQKTSKAAMETATKVDVSVSGREGKILDGDSSSEIKNETSDTSSPTGVGPAYPAVSDDDILSSKATARVISRAISDLWEGVLGNESDMEQSKNARQMQPTHASPTPLLLTDSKSVSESTEENDVLPGDKGKAESDLRQKLSYSQIGERVADLMEKIERRPRQRTRSKQSSIKSKYVLTPVEQKASDFVDFIWKGDDNAGAILGDAFSFSQVDVTSFILRQHQEDGPHLVLCPSIRGLKWFTELQGSNSRVLLVTAKGTAVSDIMEDLKPTDVVVAELSVVESQSCPDLSRFESIVLDSFAAITTSKDVTARDIHEMIGSELLSEKWWNTLLRQLASKSHRRVVLSNSSHPIQTKDPGSAIQFLQQKERVELLAAMVSFALGPDLFCSSTKSIVHRVLSWSKHLIEKKISGGNVTITQIENHLRDLLARLSFYPQNHFDGVQQAFEEKSILDTEVRLCKMSPAQQIAYNNTCRSLRGALSLGGSVADAAKAFMQLRDVCFHARLRDVPLSFHANPTQPDIYLATELIEESAKLKELALTLYRECGYDIEGISVIESSYPEFQVRSKRSGKAAKEEVPKVAILASSPHVRNVTSTLLSSLGIHHEKVENKQSVVSEASTNLSDLARNIARTDILRTWMKTEATLVRYKNAKVDAKGFPFPSDKPLVTPRACNILLGSVFDLSQQSTQSSVEASDILIFLDEDWSGRESHVMKQLLVRCFLHRARHDSERGDFRVYRFICDDCCEEKLLCGFEVNDETLNLIESNKWALDREGFLVKKESAELEDESFGHFDPDYLFEFPCRNIISFAKKDLAPFLGTKDSLPPNFESGNQMKLLPYADLPVSPRDFVLHFSEVLMSLEVFLAGIDPKTALSVSHRLVKFKSLSTEDLNRGQIQGYIEKCGKCASFGSSGASVDAYSTFRSFLPHKGSGTLNGDALDSFEDQKPGASDEDCTSIVFYNAACDSTNKKRKQNGILGPEAADGRKSSRFNAFSQAFADPEDGVPCGARDGSQGWEPLVYGPPVFPYVHIIASKVARELSALKSSSIDKRVRNEILDGNDGQKTSKRQKLESDSYLDAAIAVEITQKLREGGIHTKLQPPPASQPGNSAAVHIPRAAPGTESNPPIISEDEMSSSNPQMTLLALDEDFGLLGVGALPLKSISAHEAAKHTVEISQYFTSTGGTPNHLLVTQNPETDPEESEFAFKNRPCTDLGKIILYVSRKKLQGMRSRYATSPAMQNHHFHRAAQLNPSPTALTSVQYQALQGVNGDLSSNEHSLIKKSKKRSTPTPFAANAVGSVARNAPDMGGDVLGTNFSGVPNPSKAGKDALRYKILSMYARSGYGVSSLCESSTFRLSSIRVRDRINSRILARSRRDSQRVTPLSRRRLETSLVPSSDSLQWTAAAFIPGNAKRDDSAEDERKGSDLGPFKVGPLPSISDFLTVPHHKPSIGVSLPMGVKVPLHGPAGQPWTGEEDDRLHQLAMRLVMNWYLVSRGISSSVRSARQCRERWHSLAKTKPLLFDEMKAALQNVPSFDCQAEEAQGHSSTTMKRSSQVEPTLVSDETEAIHPSFQPSQLKPSLTLDFVNKPNKEDRPAAPHSTPQFRRSLGLIRATASKKLPTPSLPTGQTSAIVASHVSHHQSVQAAVGAGGRSELWPLQILDLADKQRGGGSPHRPGSSNSSGVFPLRPPQAYVPPPSQGQQRMAATTTVQPSSGK